MYMCLGVTTWDWIIYPSTPPWKSLILPLSAAITCSLLRTLWGFLHLPCHVNRLVTMHVLFKSCYFMGIISLPHILDSISHQTSYLMALTIPALSCLYVLWDLVQGLCCSCINFRGEHWTVCSETKLLVLSFYSGFCLLLT